MFKVECPGCKAPYQVDERRIPSSGLKMRCPKCGTSFKVDPPSDLRAPLGGALGINLGESLPPPALSAPVARAAVDLRGTIVGVAPAAAPPRPNLKGTMVGVAPAAGAAPPAPPPHRDANLKGTVVGVAPVIQTMGKPPPMPRRVPAASKPAMADYGDLDLPTVGQIPGAMRPVLPSESDDADLPIALAPPPVDDLPAQITPQVFDDLPMPVASMPRASASVSASASASASASLDWDLDLPAVAGREVSPAPSRLPALELDLPSIGGVRGPLSAGSVPQVQAFDLPSVASAQAELPSPARTGGLPAGERVRGFGEVELPSLASASLPEVSRSSLPSISEVELPSLGGRAPSGGFELEQDLPLVGQGELPSFRGRAASPGATTAPRLSHSGLPVVSGPGLPTTSVRGLPSLGGPGLPSSSNSYPSVPADDFSPLPGQAPSLPPDFGLDPIGPQLGPVSSPDFGELELPLRDAPARAAATRSGAREPEEADLFGGAPQARVETEAAIIRQSGGGTAYGEVNLGDDEGAAALPIEASPARPAAGKRDEDMEFGAIPQEDQPPRSLAPARSAVAEPRRSAEVLPSRRRLGLKLYAGLFVVLVGGAALSLVPALGPFGAYFVLDHVKAGEHAALVTSTVKAVRGALALDTYPDAQNAIETIERARSSAKRVPDLPAFEAFTSYAEELRFGADPALHARATVLLGELADHSDVKYVALARAARDASEGRAKQAASALSGTANEPEQAFLLAEVALREGEPQAAVASWQRLNISQKSPRAAFGLARALFALGDRKAAEAAARDTLAQNPKHAGARVLIARLESASSAGEADALALLGTVAKDTTGASPAERSDALTLLGDVHLARSRMSAAEAAYGEALKIDPKAARALDGLGEVLYRAGRFSEAQARFEASTQAAPDDLTAEVGVAKSKLALERVEEASALLKKLRVTAPKSIAVAYWSGRAFEASGARAQAEATYRSALEVSSTDPQTVDVYVALASLLNQDGKSDEARKVLAEARKKLPDLSAIHKALGEVALSQGRYSDATTEFRKAIALDGEDLGAKFDLGVALRRDSKLDEASKALDEVASIDRGYPGLALERGLLFEAAGRTAEALKEYEGALAKAPKDLDLMLRVGCGKVSAGHPKEAEDLLRKVLAERPNSAETNHCLGRALMLQDTRLSDALRYLERAVELDSTRAEYQLYVGWAANEAGNVPKAEHALAEALRLDQSLADAYWQRGVLRQRQGASRDAIADLTKALALRPGRSEAHAELADAYFDLGKERQALEEWQIATQAQPDNATWRFRYGKLLTANHDVVASREQLTKALELSASDDPQPRWAWEAHNLLAHAIGLKPEAVKHWEEFLRLGPHDSPYRAEAKSSLQKLGHPWAGD